MEGREQKGHESRISKSRWTVLYLTNHLVSIGGALAPPPSLLLGDLERTEPTNGNRRVYRAWVHPDLKPYLQAGDV